MLMLFFVFSNQQLSHHDNKKIVAIQPAQQPVAATIPSTRPSIHSKTELSLSSERFGSWVLISPRVLRA